MSHCPHSNTSPNGAAVNSQGRKPLDTVNKVISSPNGAAVRLLTKLLSLRWSFQLVRRSYQGLTPLAIYRRRVAAPVVLAAVVVGSCRSAIAAEFPYVAYVIENDTYVRSGPGSQHYPTGQVPAGFAVEVYRHDSEGWCAIRPPEGSFSLAPAHQLRILDSRTAEVTGSGVVARVASNLGPQRNAVQVLLERGEAVQIVEQPTPGEPWVKIAPPAGEFRWIASRRLSRTPPLEGAASPTNGNKWQSPGNQDESIRIPAAAGGADAFGHLQAASPVTSPAVANDAYPAWHPETTTTPGVTTSVTTTDDQIQVVAGSPADVVLAQHQEPATPDDLPLSDATKSGQPRIRFPGAGSTSPSTASAAVGPVDPRVAEIQLRLSQVVVGPPAAWQLAGLREETAALLANEPQANVRDQLRDLLDRIATFETVQARYRGAPAPNGLPLSAAAAQPLANATGTNAASPEGMTGQTSEVLERIRTDLGVDNSITPTPGVQPTPTPTTGSFSIGLDKPATEALYDAVGTLKPVVSRREQAPRYALVDDHGDVVTFVTASADVNLQPYIGKRIGVRGNRGFMPEYRRAHVTASRITPLEEKLVR